MTPFGITYGTYVSLRNDNCDIETQLFHTSNYVFFLFVKISFLWLSIFSNYGAACQFLTKYTNHHSIIKHHHTIHNLDVLDTLQQMDAAQQQLSILALADGNDPPQGPHGSDSSGNKIANMSEVHWGTDWDNGD